MTVSLGAPTSLRKLRDDVLRELQRIDSRLTSTTATATGAASDVGDVSITIGTALDVNVRSSPYNATGDGSTDDTAAFAAATSEARSSSRRLLVPEGTYRLSSSLDVSGLHIQMEQNAVLDFSGGSVTEACLLATGSLASMADLNANVSRGDTTITFASAHGLAQGDVFAIYDPTDSSFNPARTVYRAGEWCRVQSVDSTTQVSIDRPLLHDYVAATVECHAMTSTTLRLSGGEIRGVGTSTGVAVIEVHYGQDVEVKGTRLSGTQWSCLHLLQCVGGRVDAVHCRDYGAVGTTNYGVNLDSCRDVAVTGCVIEVRRHAVTATNVDASAGVPTRHIVVSDCVLTSDVVPPLDVHGACEYYTLADCQLSGGLSLSGDHGTIIGCACTNRNGSGSGGRGILFSEMIGTDITIAECEVVQYEPILSGRGLIDWDGNSNSNVVQSDREGVLRFEGCTFTMGGTGDDVVDIHHREVTDPNLAIAFDGCTFRTLDTSNISRILLRSDTDRYSSIRFSGCRFVGCAVRITDDDLVLDDFAAIGCSFYDIDDATAAVAVDGPTNGATVLGCDFNACRYGAQLGVNNGGQTTRLGQRILGCSFHDPPARTGSEAMHAFQVYGTGAIVQDNTIQGLDGAASGYTTAILFRSIGGICSNNVIGPGTSGSPWRAIAMDGSGGGQADTADVVCSGNVLTLGANGAGIYVNGDDCIVSENIIVEPGDDAIAFGSAFTGGCTVSGNILRETAQSAVAINSSRGDRVMVTGNTIDGFNDGIRLTTQASETREDITVRGNNISGHSDTGIEVDASGSSSDFSGLVIDDNRVRGGTRGIRIETGGASATVSRARVGSGNDCSGASTANYDFGDGITMVREGRVGTDLVTGDWAASSGWGDAATVTVASDSRDGRGRVTVAAGGSGLASNPTLTLTFADGAWPSAPFAMVVRDDNEAPTAANISVTTTTTMMEITFHGLPVTATSYDFRYVVGD